jgi:uncharacterized RDD family membrane protein YckC
VTAEIEEAEMTAGGDDPPPNPHFRPDGHPGAPSTPVYGDAPRYGYQQLGAPSPPADPAPASPGRQPFVPPQQSQNQPTYQATFEPTYLATYQPPYAQPYPPAYGPPTADAAARYPAPVYAYSPWGRRVGAYLIDFLPNLIASVPFYVGYFIWIFSLAAQTNLAPYQVPDLTAGLGWMVAGLLLLLAALGWQFYNRWLTAGRTGQSLGKRVMKMTLVAEATGQPIGPLNAFLRDLVHIVDGLAYVGYLWPLWDDKRQTFADKLMKTVVHDVQQPPAGSIA